MKTLRVLFLGWSLLTACSDGADGTTSAQGDDESTSESADSTDGTDGQEQSSDESATDESSVEESALGALTPKDPEAADTVVVDRFSDAAGTLQVRSRDNGLPAAGEEVDFDEAPFITSGLAPDGSTVRYYNFDVRPTTPAPIFALFREGEDMPVEGQLNIVDVVPGDGGYNDVWQVVKVTVPSDYVANTLTSVEELSMFELPLEPTDTLVNCPVVPYGSTASLRFAGEESGLFRGWYRGDVIYYFTFGEAPLSGNRVPVSPIYVTFNVNPNDEGGGPPSGFMTEAGSDQTHNVVATLPGDAGYSPLWSVNVYDNASFEDVDGLEAALQAPLLESDTATVNCPIVALE